MKKILLLIILILATIYFVSTRCDTCGLDYVNIGDQKILVDIADSDYERRQGLSERESQSMLLIFDKEDFHGIWMKDMLFSIDITWIDKNLKIIDIEKNVSPDTYPKVFQSETRALYILETPAGLVTLEIGDIVDL